MQLLDVLRSVFRFKEGQVFFCTIFKSEVGLKLGKLFPITSLFGRTESITDEKAMVPQRIYLAGPEVFLRNAREIGEKKKALCRKYGFEGVFPIDVEVRPDGKSPREFGLCISDVNEGLIRSCEIVIANITPFRGPSADVGTVYELGFAHALGKLVLAYTNVTGLFSERTVGALNGKVMRGDDGLLRDELGMFVEENGLVDNLMIDGCLNANSGVLVVEEAPVGELFSFLGGFERCLKAVKDRLC